MSITETRSEEQKIKTHTKPFENYSIQNVPEKCTQCIWFWFNRRIACGLNMEQNHKNCKMFVEKKEKK